MQGETDIIHYLKSQFPEYIGDDAAVIEQGRDQNYVITKDILVEDVHFRTSYFDTESLAIKALHANLSDIAAMGARAKFVLLGIAVPVSKKKYIEEFLKAFTAACKLDGVILIGGDTTLSPERLFISVTAIGTSSSKDIKRRSTAEDGDLICVAGELGAAYLGFVACERALDGFDDYKKAFLRPKARLNEGLWLGAHENISSLMDISDGLFIDLKHLCQASKLKAEIDLGHFHLHKNFEDSCKSLQADPMEAMVVGGEDYGLLFTVPKDSYAELSKAFSKKFGYELKLIGRTTKGEGVVYKRNGEIVTIKQKPFTHFEEGV